MATYPFSHFALTDPVAAQQVVSMAQIAQQEQAERDRARVGTLSAITQGNVARDNAAQQRAYSQSQLAESQRQFDTTDAFRNKALGVNTRLAESDLGNRSELELFSALQGEVTSMNPPTDLEFEARTLGMSPQRKEILNRLRLNTAMDLNRQADIAENTAARWNARLGILKPDEMLARDGVIKEFTNSKDRNYIDLDSATGSFKSLIRRPRRDPDATGAAPAVPIQDILAKLPPPPANSGGIINGMLGLAGRGLSAGIAGLPNVLPWLKGSATPAVPSAPAVPPPAAPLPPQPYDWESAVRSYLPQYPAQ